LNRNTSYTLKQINDRVVEIQDFKNYELYRYVPDPQIR
jgi:hypothetical protein